MKQKASSLLYALFILISVGTLLILIISLFLFSSKTVIQQNIEDSKFSDVNSGFNILLAENNIVPSNSTVQFDLFEDEKSLVILSNWQWGLMESINSSLDNATAKFVKSALVASGSIKDQSFFMINQNSNLSLSGKTELYGKCYLPEKGVERAFITGKPYIGDRLIYGDKLVSESTMPEFQEGFKQHIYDILSLKTNLPNDSIVVFAGMSGLTRNSFRSKCLVQYSDEGIYLNNVELKGNIKIISNKEILIGSNSSLENVIIIAPYVEIEKGFEGNCQIFASDSILINEEVHLNYPSAIVLGQVTQKEFSPFIRIGDAVQLRGAIISFQNIYDYKHPIRLYIGKETFVEGTIYNDGISQLSGVINGQIITNKLFIESPSSTYINHLQDCIINKESVSEYFVFFNIFESNSKRIISWTE